ncbi:MAG: 3-hydroxyacyl-CoA dehydrogenase [Pseudomonadota bacterium]
MSSIPNKRIGKVGVIGAGVMGSGIAAHLASAGVPVLLVDIVPKDAPALPSDPEAPEYAAVRARRNAIAAGALAKMPKSKPSIYQKASDLQRIGVGNLEDDLVELGACDWIVEAVVERLDIKQAVFAKLDAHRAEHTIITSNTSGIPLAAMVQGRSEGFRKHFLITHFFNPVRYMKLLEIVSGDDTDPAVTAKMAAFCQDDLGKGVVIAKDTINFIGNRIGVHGMMKALQLWQQSDLGIEAIDAICGEALGRPKSAIFRTADVVGLDTFGHVARNCYDNLPDDEERDVFALPEVVSKLVAAGATGQKAGAGFYKKVGKNILVLDPKAGDYREQIKFRTDSLGAAKKTADVAKRIAGLCAADDAAGQFAWALTSSSLVYAANRLGEIADDVVSVDRAMRWGFNWALGPFEIWDAIGVQTVADRLTAEGRAVPKLVQTMLAEGKTSFYGGAPGARTGLTAGLQAAPVAPLPGIDLADVRAAGGVLERNESAELLDLGDGVLCLAFASKMNALDEHILALGEKALDLCEAGKYGALVIANDGANFSVGANLMMIGGAIMQGAWKQLEASVKRFQGFTQRCKTGPVPVVTASHGMALGGGCEITMHSAVTVVGAETYMGLVEVGVGLIPGAGGTKEMTVRALAGVPADVKVDRVPLLQKAFEAMAMAKVATGAGNAFEMGFLRPTDKFCIDTDRRIGEAKKIALRLVEDGYRPAGPATNLLLPGAEGLAAFEMALAAFHWSGLASEHDKIVGTQIAKVLCGGEKGGLLSEQDLLDIEREGFLHLCGLEKTQARIRHMLETGKPLRN